MAKSTATTGTSGRRRLALVLLFSAASLFLVGTGYAGYLAWTSWRALNTVLAPAGPRAQGQAATGQGWESRGRINLLLMGLDRRPADGRIPARTDTMIVLSVDPYGKTASMLSIPRDLYVPIQMVRVGSRCQADWDRINTAMVHGETCGYPGGGAAQARDTVQATFDLPIHYTVVVDFAGFQRIIDTMGGVEIVLDEPLFDPEFPTPDGGTMSVFLPASQQRLNGEKALWYARSRFQRADYGRMHHQQKLLLAMRDQAMRLNLIPRLPELVRELGSTVTTDIPLEAALNLGRLLSAIPPDQIVGKAVEGDLVSSATTPGGAAVLLLNKAKASALVRGLFYDARLREEGASVALMDGSQRSGLASQAVAYLQAHGFEQITTESTNGTTRRDTVIIDHSGKPYTAGLAAGLLGLPTDRIKVQRNGPAATDIEIILGTDAPELN